MQERITAPISFPFWTAYLANLQLILRSPLQLISSALFPVAGLLLLYLWFISNHPITLENIGLLLLCFFFTPLITGVTLFLARRRNPLAQGPFIYSFDAEGIHASGEAFTMTIKWSAVQKVNESSSFIFFFIAPSRAHCIPLLQLKTAGCLDSVRALAQSKVTRAKENQ